MELASGPKTKIVKGWREGGGQGRCPGLTLGGILHGLDVHGILAVHNLGIALPQQQLR